MGGFPPASWQHITGTSDDGVVSAVPCRLVTVVVGTETAGQTLALHDCAAEGDVAAGNKIATVKLDSRATFDFRAAACRVGLVAVVSGGTPDITVVYA